MLDPKKLQEKADILETNLFKTISKQKDPARIQIRINRNHFPDQVINKALFQLMPRFKIKPSFYVLGLKKLLDRQLNDDDKESFFTELTDDEMPLSADDKTISRNFEAFITKDELMIAINGIPAVQSKHGEIAKSFFQHEKSAGKLLKDGVINFKEINRYPIVNAGDNLFYITHEQQGRPGISFDGQLMPVGEADPLRINIGPGVRKIEHIDKDTRKSIGYFLQSEKTGAVILIHDEENVIRHIEISDEINIKRLDYSVGNIGTQYTCPIQAKIGVICSGFRIRVIGQVQADISEGGEITTDEDAHVHQVQSGSRIFAGKDILVHSSGGSHLTSENGHITIEHELIDSKLKAPQISFEKINGLLTNNTVETENLIFRGLNFSGTNIIRFGTDLFVKKGGLIESLAEFRTKLAEIENNEKLLMGQLQTALKRLTKLTTINPDLVKHIKPVILATKTMDYKTIFREMDLIQKQYNTKDVSNARTIFERLAELPIDEEVLNQKRATLKQELGQIDRRMAMMKLEIDGILRKAATIKIFCGNLKDEDITKPDFMVESEGDKPKVIKVTGTYSHQRGFEFIQ